MTEEKMLSRIQDSVGYIIFNNPEKHNAVSIEMWDALKNFLINLERTKILSCCS